MVAADGASNYAQRLGVEKNQIVQELGWDTDTDDDIRADVEDACGGEPVSYTHLTLPTIYSV